MNHPIIGVSTNRSTSTEVPLVSVTNAYVSALLRAGALPLLLPVGLSQAQLEQVFPMLGGILLTGGGDIAPEVFGGVQHQRVYDVIPDRDAMEFSLVRMAVAQKKPFLGICRGIQVINVALGGTLYTHIADQLDGALRHDWFPNIPRDHLGHEVAIAPNCQLAEILGSTHLGVNSLHHQGVAKVAPALRVIATAPDSLVEAIEYPGHPFGLGVQWHPEWLPDSPAMQALFSAFVQAAVQE